MHLYSRAGAKEAGDLWACWLARPAESVSFRVKVVNDHGRHLIPFPGLSCTCIHMHESFPHYTYHPQHIEIR